MARFYTEEKPDFLPGGQYPIPGVYRSKSIAADYGTTPKYTYKGTYYWADEGFVAPPNTLEANSKADALLRMGVSKSMVSKLLDLKFKLCDGLDKEACSLKTTQYLDALSNCRVTYTYYDTLDQYVAMFAKILGYDWVSLKCEPNNEPGHGQGHEVVDVRHIQVGPRSRDFILEEFGFDIDNLHRPSGGHRPPPLLER